MKIKLVISISMIATLGLPLSAQTPIPNALMQSNQGNAQLGQSVASAGDINGDGYDDVISGAWGYDNGQTDEGAAFIYMGSATGVVTTPAAILECNQANGHIGAAVASAGDVNADGYDDVIVSARYYDNGQTDEGAAFIYHGSAAGIITTPAATLECNQAYASFGCSVSGAGDINGDGFDDVIVGAPGYDNGQTNEGRVYVFLGSASGVITTPIATMESDQAYCNFGNSCAVAGDVNNDGYDDVIVGAEYFQNGQYREGKVFIYHGNATGINTTAALTLEGNYIYYYFGWSVSGAGDTNGDGYSDVVIGAKYTNMFENDEGRVYIFRGSATGINPDGATVIEGDVTGGNFGCAVSGAGDTNNDGYDDILVGGFDWENGQDGEGMLFVYKGSAAGVNTTAIRTMESDQANAWLGYTVGGGGDVNGDGYDDLIGGALLYDNGDTDEGAVYVYYGQCGAPEICNSIDDDCDGFIDEGLTYLDYYTDADFDGHGAGSPTSSCNPIPGKVTNNADCNDAAAAIHPGAIELCNGIDDDCDAFIDEGIYLDYYTDSDADGFGTGSPTSSCNPIPGYVINNTDCDDANPNVHPIEAGVPQFAWYELGYSSEWGFDDWAAWQTRGAPDVYPAYGDSPYAWAPWSSDGSREFIELAYFYPMQIIGIDIYETLNPGSIDTVYVRNPILNVWEIVYSATAIPGPEVATILHITFPLTAYEVSAIRIAMNSPAVPGWNEIDAVSIIPGELNELCNGIDDDCNGVIDNGFTLTSFYADVDADTYGDISSPMLACAAPAGFVTDFTDCDDTQSAVYPGAAEVCNGIDDNCNGTADDGVAETISISAAGATTFCSGGSVVLTAVHSGVSLQWKKNGVNIPGATGISYTVTKTGDYTCQTTSACGTATSTVIPVVVNKTPSASISAGGPTTFCAGGSVTLTETPVGGSSYQWYKGATAIPGATTTTYIATTSGNYKCRVTKTATGCFKNSNTIAVSVVCREGDVLAGSSFQLYPNPANDVLTIETDLATEKTFYLTDALGQILQTITTSENTITIDLNNISSGVYFIKMEDGVNSVTQKFIKQ